MARKYRITFLGFKIPLYSPGIGGLIILNFRRKLVRRYTGRYKVFPYWIFFMRIVIFLPLNPYKNI